jgi:hypothetical protein
MLLIVIIVVILIILYTYQTYNETTIENFIVDYRPYPDPVYPDTDTVDTDFDKINSHSPFYDSSFGSYPYYGYYTPPQNDVYAYPNKTSILEKTNSSETGYDKYYPRYGLNNESSGCISPIDRSVDRERGYGNSYPWDARYGGGSDSAGYKGHEIVNPVLL